MLERAGMQVNSEHPIPPTHILTHTCKRVCFSALLWLMARTNTCTNDVANYVALECSATQFMRVVANGFSATIRTKLKCREFSVEN